MRLDSKIVESELEKLKGLPAPVKRWEIETGRDWTDNPVVWVWVVLEDREIDYETRAALRNMVRERVSDVAHRETNADWWPLVQFRRAGAETERTH